MIALTYIDEIDTFLKTFILSGKDIANINERQISKLLIQHFISNGAKVTHEKHIGFLKFKIDIDYKDGCAGIEVKRAEKLVSEKGDNGEAQRLLGQVFYYAQNYTNIIPVVMVLVVGDEKLEKSPNIKEIKKYVEKAGAKFRYLKTH
ncbi:MAG: hypothetical protein HJHJAOHD_02056 [Flavobacteriales bacterium]|nr:hypothetical protein [Flavobacteriales bacterium]